MENVKTIILTLLVVLSLFQSYLLSFSSPKFEPINQSDYVQTDWSGTQMTLDKLIFPEQFILHLGNQNHAVAYPETAAFHYLFDNIKQTTFDGFRRINPQAAGLQWDEIRNQYQ